MRAILKKVGEAPKIIEIENTLEALQDAVGGWIEAIYLDNNAVLICDEEGKLKGLPSNFVTSSDIIVGDVLFVSVADEDFTDITAEAEQTVMDLLGE